jgi:hypothetical protein
MTTKMDINDQDFVAFKTLLEGELWRLKNSRGISDFECAWNDQTFDGYVARVNNKDEACRAFMHTLQKYFRSYSEKPFHFLVISTDDGAVDVLGILKPIVLFPNHLTVIFYNEYENKYDILNPDVLDDI